MFSIRWKNQSDWEPFYGQMSGTTNYELNLVLNFFVHNIFIHSPHHVQPAIPFYNLPQAYDILKNNFKKDMQIRNSIVKDYFTSVKYCKLFDVKSGKWIRYNEKV